MKIVVCDSAESLNRDLSIEMEHLKKVLGEETKIVVCEENEERLLDELQDADGMLTSYMEVDRELMEKCKSLKAISIEATGYNFVDAVAAADNNIGVSVIGEYCTQEVADHTMALMLAVARKLKHYQHQMEVERKYDYNSTSGMFRLEGSTLGIMGLGKIGKAVAKRAQGFGMKVIAYHPNLDRDVATALNVELVGLQELFEQSNVISLHMRQTEENVGILNQSAFSQMKKKPIIVNVSRGAMIVEADLVDALDQGLVFGAGLDVLENETADAIKDHILAKRENVVLTPHSAFYSDTSLYECQRIGAENLAFQLKKDYSKVFRMVTEVTK